MNDDGPDKEDRGPESPLPQDDAARAAALVFHLGDFGHGTQLTALEGAAGRIHFAPAALIQLVIREVQGGGTRTLTPSDFPEERVFQDARSFTIIRRDGGSGEIRIRGELTPGGALRLTASARLNDDDAAGHSIWAADFPNLAVKPVGDAGRMACAFPLGTGVLELATTRVRPLGALVASHPGIYLHGQADEVTGLLPASFQYVHHYDRDSGLGLFVRTSDSQGHGKEFVLDGNGTATLFRIRQYPADHRSAANRYDSAFPVELQVLKGSWYDGADHYRGTVEAEAAPWLARGPVFERGVIPAAVSTAPLNLWVIASPDLTVLQRQYEEIARIVSVWNVNPTVFLYGWHSNRFDHDWPDWSPVKQKVWDFARDIAKLGCRILWYTNQQEWDPEEPWFHGKGEEPTGHNATAYGPPATLVIIGENGELTKYPQLDRPEARKQIIDQWAPLLRGGTTRAHGFYLDAGTTFHHGDYRPTLPPEEKGPHAPAYRRGFRALLDEQRHAWEAIMGSPFALVTEGASEDVIAQADWFSGSEFNLVISGHWMPIFETVYSRWMPMFTFAAYGTTTAAEPGVIEDFFWNATRMFHSGRTQMLVVTPSLAWIVGKPEDPDYEFWQATVEPYTTYVKNLARAWDSGPRLRRYFWGRRLRPLPGSYDEHVEQHGITVAPIPKPQSLNFTGPRVHSSVWQSASPAESPIGVLLTNHSAFKEEFTIRMSRDRWPEMGPGRRHLIENVAGAQTRVLAFEGALDHRVAMAPRSFRVFEIVAPPES